MMKFVCLQQDFPGLIIQSSQYEMNSFQFLDVLKIDRNYVNVKHLHMYLEYIAVRGDNRVILMCKQSLKLSDNVCETQFYMKSYWMHDVFCNDANFLLPKASFGLWVLSNDCLRLSVSTRVYLFVRVKTLSLSTR